MSLVADSSVDWANNPYAAPALDGEARLIPADVVVGEEGWTINYEMTPEDLIALGIVAATTSRAKQETSRVFVVMGVLVYAVPLVWTMILLKIAPVSGWMAPALGLAVLVSIFGSVMGFVRAYYASLDRRYVDYYRHPDNANALGPRRIRIAPDGVHDSSPHSQSLTRWQGIMRIESQPDAVYLFTTGFSGFIAPKRAFAEDELFRQFAKVAGDFHAQATRGNRSVAS